ncbi:MAG: bifunctional (p)ppGpp synthetase/guanosine-3',5'-bis(diphosphate) 3'-pyrophosphohydrolase [Fimbriimonadaceae bacterium]|nr:bifunctional (p)ppGpp synthetase/guanosine-3',5'-bis(diphosphate) 3'-pyrophosphohydrolase [Fimbriimonadaceae bacterium]
MKTNPTDRYHIDDQWEEPEALHELTQKLYAYHPESDLVRVRYAYYFAEKAHAGKLRSSGDPYITHPLAVAHIVADLRMDDDSVVSALLHDTVEDCEGVTVETITSRFGPEVGNLVDGVTKLSWRHVRELGSQGMRAQETIKAAESLRKMLLAMAKDFRVMVIKLADRLHNMITLDSLPPEKRTRIATETMDVYAPLAARLGIWQIKWQLEDLAFKHLHPAEFKQMTELVSRSRAQRETDINRAIGALRERLESEGIRDAEIQGRPKHLYSIFNKMIQQGLDFDQIFDLTAIRIIVNTIPECYQAVGAVHALWVPMGNLFYDYIAKQKSNGYQSLHTKVIGPHGEPMEVQIRTRRMHEIAEFGVAAHWTYKEGRAKQEETQKLATLRQQLFDWSSDARMSSDFLRSLSTDLFAEQVFVFTPRGDVMDLPKGATPIDFAFRVHTQVGMTLVGAKVNGHIVTLSTPLKNGDVCELITRSNAAPSLDWLDYAKTSHAKSRVRAYFRRTHRDEYAQKGKEAIERELKTQGLEPREFLGEDRLTEVAKAYEGCHEAEDLLAKVGGGLVSVQSVVQKLVGNRPEPAKPNRIESKRSDGGKTVLVSTGASNLLVRRARCCEPIPGDDVVGYVTRGRGIMLHRSACPNAQHLRDTEPERLVEFDWPADGTNYPVWIRILAQDRQGLLMDVSTVFAETKANVGNATIRMTPGHTAEISLTLEVQDAAHLSHVMNRVGQYQDVISVLRKFGRGGAN